MNVTNHLGNVLVVVSDKKTQNCPTEIVNFDFSTTPNLNGAWYIKNSFQGQNATITVADQKLLIHDNQTSTPYARVNYFMPSDLIKNNSHYP